MADEPRVTLILTGPFAGKTKVINHTQFVNGAAVVYGPRECVDGLLSYMSRYYGAFPAGSPELAEAQERDRVNGLSSDNASAAAEREDAAVLGSDGAAGVAVVELRNDELGADDGVEPAKLGVSGADRDGHADSRVLSDEADAQTALKRLLPLIKRALKKFDPYNDELWVQPGADSRHYKEFPRVEVVQANVDFPAIPLTRNLVTLAWPEFDRDFAKTLRKERLAKQKAKAVN